MAQEAMALVKEAPPEQSFKLHKTSIEIRSVPELAEALEIMSDESFAHHVNEQKNDFATWVQDIIHDTELSAKLKAIHSKAAAFEIVKKRAKELGGQAYTYQSTLFGFNLWDVVIGFIGGLIIGLFLGHFLVP